MCYVLLYLIPDDGNRSIRLYCVCSDVTNECYGHYFILFNRRTSMIMSDNGKNMKDNMHKFFPNGFLL